jgi:hypothetical protein
MKDEHAPVHEHEHAEPTVIHHPEEDMTILARWLKHGMDQGAQFWVLVGAAIVALVAIALISSGLAGGKMSGNEAWLELTSAKTVEDRIKIADAHPNTPAASWAKLYSAREEYDNGIDDLTTPGRKDLAGPRLKKALELFQLVAKEAGKDTTQAVCALFGVARTFEARNELPEAIEQYKLVIERFPKSPEAKQAQALIKALEEPLNQMFYKELYSYKPPATPSPPSGLGGLGAPGSFLNPDPNFGLGQPTKPLTPETMKPPADLDAPPPSTPPTPAIEPPKSEAPKKDEKPAAPTDAPKPEPPKAEAPASQPAPPK